jgi:hypothetical protein
VPPEMLRHHAQASGATVHLFELVVVGEFFHTARPEACWTYSFFALISRLTFCLQSPLVSFSWTSLINY